MNEKTKRLLFALALLLSMQGFFMPTPASAQLKFTPSPKAPGSGGLVFTPSSSSSAQITALNATINAQNVMLVSLRGQLASAQTSLSAAQTSLATANASLSTANASLSTANANLATKTALAASLQTQVNSLNTQIGGLATQVSGLNASVVSLTAQNNTLTSQNSTLTASNSTLTTSVSGLNAQVSTLTASVSSLTGQVSTLNASVSSLTSQVSTLTTANGTLTTANTTLTAANGTLTSQLAAANASLAAATGTPRMVYALAQPSSDALYDDGVEGEEHALLTGGNSGPTSVTPAMYLQQAVDIGIDVLDVDLIGQTSTAQMQSYFNTNLPVAATLGLKQTLCIDISSVSPGSDQSVATALETQIKPFVTLAKTGNSGGPYTAVPLNNGVPVIFSYAVPAPVLALIKNDLASQSIPISLNSDVGGTYLQNSPSYNAALTTLGSYMAVSGSGYSFGTFDSPNNTLLPAGFEAAQKPWAYTVRPGLYRGGSGGAPGYIDTGATATLRSYLASGITSSFVTYPDYNRSLHITTFDDWSEETGVQPSANLNYVRSDITAEQLAKFHGVAAPLTGVRILAIVPQYGYLGQTAPLKNEVVVINNTPDRLTLTVKVMNQNANAIGNQFGGGIAPNTTTAYSQTAPIPIDAAYVSSAMAFTGANPATKIRCTLTDDTTGTTTTSTGQDLTALTLISPYTSIFNMAAPTNGGQMIYYGVDSAHQPSVSVNAAVNIKSSGQVQLTCNGFSGVVRAIELLNRTRRTFVAYGTTSITLQPITELPRARDDRQEDPALLTSTPYYFVRVIFQDGSEWYSEPILPTHNG